jgi:hypothetical protein
MNLLKLDMIEGYLLAFMAAILGLFLFYPDSGAKIGNSVLSTRIFTNIVVGGDIVEPEILTPGPTVPVPIVAPIPSITPVPAPSITNFSTNYPATNSATNTNNIAITNN